MGIYRRWDGFIIGLGILCGTLGQERREIKIDIKFGALPSPPDYRDYLYRAIFLAEKLPPKYSRRSEVGMVRDQGKFGTCVGFAAAAVKDNQESREAGKEVVTSPLYLYTRCKEQDGIPEQEGTYLRVVMSVLKNQGVCSEVTWPYTKMEWPSIPIIPSTADQEAAEYKIGAYARLTMLDEIKQSVVKDGPVLAGILVCENFLNPVAGFVDTPEGVILGGHAICVVGYDDKLTNGKYTGFFEVRNSWGTSWGDNGYCWIPYEFFKWRSDLGMAAWMESWSSIDIILPKHAAQEGCIWIGKDYALIDGREVQLDVAPFIVPEVGRTMVPLRFMAEHFGYHIEWSESLQRIRFWK